MRIYIDVVRTLASGSRRGELIKLMQEAGVSPLPDEDAWRRYTDPKTGDINIGLVYSRYMERYLCRICEKFAPNKTTIGKKLFPIQAYILTNFSDLTKVPSMEHWSEKLGPIQKGELLLKPRFQDTVSIALVQANLEAKTYGRNQIEPAVSSMTLEEQERMVQYSVVHGKELFETMRARLLFAAQVMLAINTLHEIKAIQRAAQVFLFESRMRQIIQYNGSWYPESPRNLHQFRKLPFEDKTRYYCFNLYLKHRTRTPLHLFLTLCSEHYGHQRHEGIQYFLKLSDLQQAALNFPFYYPITPKGATSIAFRKFYVDICNRYGFSNKSGCNSLGNRLLEAALRRKWKMLDPSERAKFYEPDTPDTTFPLHPSSSDEVSKTVSCKGNPNEPEASSQNAKNASASGSAEAVDVVESTRSSEDHSSHLSLTNPQPEGSLQPNPTVCIEEGGEDISSVFPLPVHEDSRKVKAPSKAEMTGVGISVKDVYRMDETETSTTLMVI